MKKYQFSALIGIVLMGISSFTACLSQVSSIVMLGNVGLVVSMLITAYGFSRWQP